MQRSVFIIVSFEGTDACSQAGGLGVRVSGLARTLADLQFETHLFFFGDPQRPGEERDGPYLTLHRWGQWISANCPGGVYDGEEEKVRDLTRSLPSYLVDRLIRPAVAAGRMPVVLFEEWQTAACACSVADLLRADGLREQTVLFWTANNSYGFDRVDWPRLASCATINTISRYMRSIIRSQGVDALVIPNGIPAELLAPVRRAETTNIRTLAGSPDGVTLFFKMARWEREKGWAQAIGAVSELRARGSRPLLVARAGGPSTGSDGLEAAAAERGLRLVKVADENNLISELRDAGSTGTDVISLRFGVTTRLARALFAASDAVLANSIYEPFGLVGLEAMAAGGLAYTGGTGEDYAVDGRNAVVLQTLDPREIADRHQDLSTSPERAARIRRAARNTARDYSWQRVAAVLLQRVAEQATRQGIRIIGRGAADGAAFRAYPRNSLGRRAG